MARLAGVSAITVSRALRKPDLVSLALRKKIDSAVATLGYVPNTAASRLASARTHSIGVIVPTLYNIIFADYLKALDEIFLPVGFQVVVVNSRYSVEEEEAAIRTLLGQRVEAIVIVGVHHSKMSRRMLTQSRIPVIETFQLSPDPIHINIGLDQTQAGYDATSYLIDKGYKNIGFLFGNRDERALERLKGYERAISAAGNSANGKIISVPAASSVALGAKVMRKLISESQLPDAVFCIDDNLALGAMQECRRAGLSVPENIAIMGFHDLEFAECSSPSLSSVQTQRHKMGQLAAQHVLRMLNGGATIEQKIIRLDHKIMERQSTVR